MKRKLLSIFALLTIVITASAQIGQNNDLNSGISPRNAKKNANIKGAIHQVQSMNVLKASPEWSTPQAMTIDGTETLTGPARIYRDATPSTFANPKSFPGTFSLVPTYFRTVTIPTTFLTKVTLRSTYISGGILFTAAYLNSFDPANLATNYLADIGSSSILSEPTKTMEFIVPSGNTLILVFMNADNSSPGTITYEYILDTQFNPIKITKQPTDGSICIGGNYTFTVEAAGGDLIYQWYKGNNPIMGANTNTLTINNATRGDYEQYYAVIKNSLMTVTSSKATLWVAEPLSDNMKITKYPNPAITGLKYDLVVDGYIDVNKYTWSYSVGGATFNLSPNASNEASVVFSGAAAGKGTISVVLEHVCGNKTITQDIVVKWPTGIADINNNKIWIGPNPMKERLTIDSQLAIDNVTISDLSGKIIFKSSSVVGSQLSIDCSGWAKGVYLVKVDKGNNINVYKVIKN